MRMQKLKEFLLRYKHAWILSYFIVYMIWFVYLEQRRGVNYYYVHMNIDDYIPFCEYFIIPYLIWFVFIAGTMVYFLFTSATDFYKYCAMLFTGMTICLLIYTIFPNAQGLRPAQFEKDTIFTRLVAYIYATDTPTNVCPSIHVLNSVGAFLAIFSSDKLRKHKWFVGFSGLLSISICMSTVFLKQHSSVDVICGFSLAVFLYVLVYKVNYQKLFASFKEEPISLKKDKTSNMHSKNNVDNSTSPS